MKKSNDKGVPADEMLLAEAIAAARARGLVWADAYPFVDDAGVETDRAHAIGCCAVGALVLAGKARLRAGEVMLNRPDLDLVHMGNDWVDRWFGEGDRDRGESLGWAFRCAMTQEDA